MEQETLKKFDEMKYIMEETRKPSKESSGCTGDTRPSHRVGIFTEVGDNDFGWLHGALSSYYFSNVIKTIRFIDTSDIDLKKLLEQISSCTIYIFICSGYHRGTFSAIRKKIGFIFERKNLIIILQNLQDSTDREKRRILQENRDYIRHKENLILFSKMEQGSNFLSRLVNDHPPRSMRGKSKGSRLPHVKSLRFRKHISSNHQERQDTRNHKSADVKFSAESVRYDPTLQEERKRPGPDSKAFFTGFTEEHYSQTTGHRVGIFSRSSDGDYSWLVRMLRSEDFRSQVSAVRSWRISKDTVREFIQEVGECTFGILYQNKKLERDKVTTIKSHLQLETLCSILGKQNVIILIDDVEDSSDYEMSRILKTQHEAAQWAANLLLVSDLDKMTSLEMIKRKLRIQMQMQGSDRVISTNPFKHEQRKSSIMRRFSSFGRKPNDKEHLTSQGPEIKHHTVGIFSRSSDRDYSWLVTMLRSEDFHRHVSSVQSYIIYNNQSYQKFLDTISQCTFGILYHSKNRGLVNVTNVTDSLYDQELETLYMIIGKENVLVIIDDLEDSSDSRKTWILQEQHSIGEWAADLLLVSHNDKKDRRILRQKMNNLKTLLQGPGKNTIVIIDDLEDASDQQKRIILHTQPMIAHCADDLILISYEDKTDTMGQSAKSKILNHFLSTSGERLKYPAVNSGNENVSNERSTSSLKPTESTYLKYIPSMPRPSTDVEDQVHSLQAASIPSRSIIGIFSRSEEEDYSWLKRLLTSEELGHKTVQCCHLSGSDNEALLKVAFKLQLGILYHSVKNGKIRLTDFEDSLYHEELEKLSTRLGKRKMIVVIDDLDDSGDKIKQKILNKQPSLGRLTGDIFLFTEAEKKEVDRQSQGKHGKTMSESARDKISNIMRLIT